MRNDLTTFVMYYLKSSLYTLLCFFPILLALHIIRNVQRDWSYIELFMGFAMYIEILLYIDSFAHVKNCVIVYFLETRCSIME